MQYDTTAIQAPTNRAYIPFSEFIGSEVYSSSSSSSSQRRVPDIPFEPTPFDHPVYIMFRSVHLSVNSQLLLLLDSAVVMLSMHGLPV